MPSFPLQKTTSAILLVAYLNVLVPVVPAYALMTEPTPPGPALPEPVRTPATVTVNRTAPATLAAPVTPGFSAQPTVQEIFQARVLPEPFVPLGGTPSAEANVALAAAITAFIASGGLSLDPFEQFLDAHPQSPWAASVNLNLGLRYFSTGWFTPAMEHYESAWTAARNLTDSRGRAIADRAFGEFALMNARVGRKDTLVQLLATVADRSFTGQASELVAGARDGLALMQTHPELAYRCGPGALDRILARQQGSRGFDTFLFNVPSTDRGTSLASVAGWATQAGLNLQPAFRSPGAAVLSPAVVHWKLGHYAALFAAGADTYQLEDPTFGARMTATTASLDAEASGYFLVPAGALPAGWRSVSLEEAAEVWGKGSTNNVPTEETKTSSPTAHPTQPGCGMAVANAHLAVVSLNLTDTPVGYAPPFGPSVYFTLTYNQREASQPSVPDYSNVGTKWIHNWLSFIDEQITVVSSVNQAKPTIREAGGGSTIYPSAADPGTYPLAIPKSKNSSALLSKSTASTYILTQPDGSQQVFGRKVGAVSPYRYFLTQVIDPAGNALTLGYDSQNRLVSVTDALGQVTTLAYELTADPLKITKITDPFGRYAVIGYDTSGRLNSITDVLGLVSAFTYSGTGDFVDSMTTPYGTSNFAYGESGAGGRNRWLEIANALGEKERIECRNDWPGLPDAGPVPTGMTTQTLYQNYRNTLFWDRKAYKDTYSTATPDAATSLAGARIYHWLHTDDTLNTASSVLDNEKYALEGARIWYNYPGQTNVLVEGTSSQPSKVGRVLDDGTTQLYQYAYNNFDRVTQVIDPLGRQTDYIYATNQIDLLEVRQKTGTSAYEVLAKATYNSAHQPLTATDAAGQVTTFTYNTRGQPLTVVNAKNETTTFNYNIAGYLTSVDGPLAGTADATTFAYDGYGRLRTVTDSEGYAVTTDYDVFDRPTLVTYPDGTTQQIVYNKLDVVTVKDRRGRLSRTTYNAIRQPVTSTDPLGRVTQFGWCKCGDLRLLVDAAGNTTNWTHDARSRVTSKQFADGTTIKYNYETNTSRLKSVIDAKGQVTNYAYFKDNQLQQVSYANATVATPSVSFTYEANYPRMATMVDGVGTTTYAYNPIPTTPTLGAGRLASIDGPWANDTLGYTYDELGRVLNRSIDGANNTTTAAYDALGRVTGVTNPLGAFTYAYVNATGRMASVSYPNSQVTNYAYWPNQAASAGNGDQRLKEIANLLPGGANLSTFGYGYDKEGVIQSWTRKYDTSSVLTSNFKYDLADQLTEAAVPSASSVLKEFVYRYDKAGNRASEQVDNAVSAGTHNNLNQLKTLSATGPIRFEGTVDEPANVTVNGVAATVDSSGVFKVDVPLAPGSPTAAVIAVDGNGNTATKNYQVTVASGTSRTLTYDLNGNMLSNGAGQTYEWDAADRLVKITQTSGVTEFIYDGAGRRVKEKLNGTEIKRWVWCGEPQPCEERDASNIVTKRFYAGLGEQIGGVNYFYTTDHLGSVREMTDSTGAIRARYDYDLYGNTSKTSGDLEATFGFTGFYRHQASYLDLTHFRAYYAELGRWLSRDPIGERGGMNLYGYVENSPSNSFDPLGLWVITLRLNFTATALLGVNLSLAIAFDDSGNIVIQKSGQPNLPGLKKLNAISLGPPLGAASASLTGGFSITNADTVCEQYGKTNSIGVYAGAGPAVEVNGVWGKGKTDDGRGHYVGMDFGIGVGSPGVAAQGSITDTKEAFKIRKGP